MRNLLLNIVLSLMVCAIPAGAASPSPSTSVRLKEAVRTLDKEHFSEALEQFITIMRQAEKEHDDCAYIACTGYIGNIYSTFEDYNSCVSYYLKGYHAAVRIGDKDLQSSFLSNIINVYCRLGLPKKARYYYALAQRTPSAKDPMNRKYFLIYAYARILTAEHKYEKAVATHRSALDYATEKRLKPIFMLYQLSEIGNLYVLMGRDKEAIAIGDSCQRLSRKLDSGELLTNAYKMLANAYDHDGQPDSARRYRDLFFALNDSVYNTKKFFKARHKLTEYEEEQNLRELIKLNERISYQMYIIVSIIFFFLLLAIFAWIIYKKNQRLLITQRLLIDKNKEMEQRDTQNQKLLAHYVEQNGQSAATERITERAEGKTKASQVRIAEDEERRLLNSINSVLSDLSVISNPDFSLRMLADAVQSNTKYVSHVINSNYHKPFKTLLNELRIRAACHKLTDTERYGRYTMQAVYEEVGYTNAVSFIRAFKKIYGMPPSEYRKLAAKEKPEE